MNLIEMFSAEAAASDKSAILLPAGSLEQHGTEAPLGCDGIIAEALCRKAGELTGCPVLPCLYYGNSHCHTGFSGTFSLSVETSVNLITDIISEAGRNGFRKLLILSGHGGNRIAAEKAISELKAKISAEYSGYWQLPGYTEKEEELFGKTGYHITTSEVSMVWHILKKPVPGVYSGCYPKTLPNTSDFTPEQWKEKYPDGGVGGDMSRVSTEKGCALFDYAVDMLAEKIREIRK